MQHLGWKIIFGVSWIPGGLLYYMFTFLIFQIDGPTTEAAETGFAQMIAGLGVVVLLIPTILFLGLQVALGYLAFRK